MHTQSLEPWTHDHTFGQEKRTFGERRTLIVIGVTAATMAVEIAAGLAYGSMALLADGLHMASHASALGVSAFAYYFTRRYARDPRFSFGTGKVNSLAAFANAVMLALFALVMAGESLNRFVNPVPIVFNQAILVAFIGLLVNGVCLAILGGHGHGHAHDHHHDHHHDHAGHAHAHPGRHDHNLRSAYIHVLADALTSLLAIFALLGAKHLGQQWLDPFMGIVGACLVLRWSWGLLRLSSRVLLDLQAPADLRDAVRQALESDGDTRVSDLHVWAIGPGIHAAEIALVSSNPLPGEAYRRLLPDALGIVHATVEARRCPSHRRNTEPVAASR